MARGERVADVPTHPAFRNAARSVARLYDAMHAAETTDLLCAEDRQGIRTHRFFMPSYSADDLLAAREAIAHWSRMSYGHMGRTPDYKASFMATLGADPGWYAPFEESGRQWYRRYAESALFLNHVLINPPIDRDKAVHEVEDVYDRFYRGSTGDAPDRIKLFKLIWDAVGTEFGARHEWYEINYSGNQEQMRLDMLRFAGIRGVMGGADDLVEQCLSEYDLDGWTGGPWEWEGDDRSRDGSEGRGDR